MKKFALLSGLFAILLFAIFTAKDARAMFNPLFFAGPYDAIVVNGEKYPFKRTEILPRVWNLEWLGSEGKTVHVWVEKYNMLGHRVSQFSPGELSIESHQYDKEGRWVGEKTTFMFPDNPVVTPLWQPPRDGETGYELTGGTVVLSVLRDEKGVARSGTIKSSYKTASGEEFHKTQQVEFSYPDANTMKMVFLGYGTPWAYIDSQRTLRRTADGKQILEICRGKAACE